MPAARFASAARSRISESTTLTVLPATSIVAPS